MAKGISVLLTVVLALLTGCTSDPQATSSPSASAEQLTVVGAPSGTKVTVTDMVAPLVEGLTSAGPTYSITPSGKLPTPATVTVHLKDAQPDGALVVIGTRETQDGPWSYQPATLSADRLSASITTTHFSWFTPYIAAWSDLVDAFKSQLAEGLSGGLYQDVPKPKCAQEKDALTDGYSVISSKSDAVFWCLGMQDGQRILKLVNHRRYPMMVEHSAKVVAEASWTRYANLAALSRTFSGKDSVLSPGDTIVYAAETAPGTYQYARTSIDGFGQSLVAIQTAADALLFILVKLGVKQLNSKELLRWMDGIVTASDCVQAFPNPGKVLTKCFDDKALAGLVGVVWAPVAGALLTGAGVLAFLQGEINMLTDTLNGNGRYTVKVVRPKAPEAPTGLEMSFTGLGRAKIGQSMDAFAKALGGELAPATPDGTCYVGNIGPADRGLQVLTDDGRNGKVRYVHYRPNTFRTPLSKWPVVSTTAGIKIGSTLKQIEKAYPADDRQPAPYDPDSLWVSVFDSSGRNGILFEVDPDGVVVAMRAGLAEQIGREEGCS